MKFSVAETVRPCIPFISPLYFFFAYLELYTAQGWGDLVRVIQRDFASLLPLVPAVVFIVLTIPANLDLTLGRFALFMDERITFDGVRAILNPPNFQDFVYAITDGGDLRYGRILWNVLALVSWIPELIFGESGQIIASRMVQVGLLVASVLLISYSLLKHWATRTLFGLAVFAIPYMAYYATMPKPEPIQVFLVTLFFVVSFRNGETNLFGKHWILLGLAFGAKIATLPVMLAVLAGGLLFRKNLPKPIELFASGIWFALGLGLAVPTLLLPMLLIFASGYFYAKFDIGKFGYLNYGLTLLAISTVSTIGFVDNFAPWIDRTFLNTGHGADRDDVNFFSWIDYFMSDWVSNSIFLSLMFVFLVVLAWISSIRRLYLENFAWRQRLMIAVILFASGTGLSLAIMLSAQRLWGMYLFPGFFFQLAGLFVLVEYSLSKVELRENLFTKKKELAEKFSGFSMVTVLLALSLFDWIPDTTNELQRLSTRTESQEFKEDLQSYEQLERFMDEYSKLSSDQLLAVVSPRVFHRESDSDYEVVEFFGPYTYWSEPIDLIVLTENNTPSGEPKPPESPEFERYLIEQEGYIRHVVNDERQCDQIPCYKVGMQMANQAQLLVRIE